MRLSHYPSRKAVEEAQKADDPILALIALDGGSMLLGPIDECLEHVILLKQLGHPEQDLDQYFRVVLNRKGADWTFVCPPGYKNIPSKEKRIEQFYSDGFKIIPAALKTIGYDVPLEIPVRFRRHIHLLRNGDAGPEKI